MAERASRQRSMWRVCRVTVTCCQSAICRRSNLSIDMYAHTKTDTNRHKQTRPGPRINYFEDAEGDVYRGHRV